VSITIVGRHFDECLPCNVSAPARLLQLGDSVPALPFLTLAGQILVVGRRHREPPDAPFWGIDHILVFLDLSKDLIRNGLYVQSWVFHFDDLKPRLYLLLQACCILGLGILRRRLCILLNHFDVERAPEGSAIPFRIVTAGNLTGSMRRCLPQACCLPQINSRQLRRWSGPGL